MAGEMAVDPKILWTSITSEAYADERQRAYQAALMEQYKLFLDVANENRRRRATANSFFLTINTAIFALIGTFWEQRPTGTPWALALPLIVVLVECGAWALLITAYRTRGEAGWRTLQEIEQRLPAAMITAGLATVASRPNRLRRRGLTDFELVIPVLFAGLYVVAFVAAVVTSA